MSPGNCSGSYSAPPRARAIACRSSSFPREVDATTFSIWIFAEQSPPKAGNLQSGAVSLNRTHAVRYIIVGSLDRPHSRSRLPQSRERGPPEEPWVLVQVRPTDRRTLLREPAS